MDNAALYFCGFAGCLIAILIKIQQLKAKSKVANHAFSLKDYFSDDYPSIILSFVVVVVSVIAGDELLRFKPALVDYLKWFYVFVGFGGTVPLLAVFSVFNRKIMAVIDIKTNIADGVEPAVDATNKEGVAEIKKDNNTPPLTYSAPRDQELNK